MTYSICRYGAGSYGACGYVVMWLWVAVVIIKHCYKRRARNILVARCRGTVQVRLPVEAGTQRVS
ncbi:hypothetical protein ID852_12005 [Xenorhabdus sp. 42]|uniref:hypothetical protein n=1 Tax=Xenorhabdus szentirmaii TaxID=290112 RepID=UPI0019B9138B|nr:hypothetical protein [Xenorhabdus sp. 42]MBD2821401.1 hypothetical protein [Xenorhabdus sp. 42]